MDSKNLSINSSLLFLAPHTNRNRKRRSVSEAARRKMAHSMAEEYEFYEFVRQRLREQFDRL